MATAATLDVDKMRVAASEAAGLLKALANSDRLLILCHLSQGERCVSELEQALAIQQPTLSQQLTVLRSQGLVDTRREGKWIHYSVCDAKALALLQTLYALFCVPAKRRAR